MAFSTDQFRRELAASRAAQSATGSETVVIDGISFVARRTTMTPYLASGRVPQRLANMLSARDAEEESAAVDETLTVGDLSELGKFVRLVITDSVIEPRVVFEERPLQAGEVSAYELPTGWLEKVYAWSLYGGAKIATESGEVTADQLDNFRNDREGPQQPVDSGSHSTEFRPKTKRVARSTGSRRKPRN